MLRSARRHHALSALVARRAVTEARKALPEGLVAVAKVVATHQVTQAVMSERAVGEMLAEQDIDAAAEALLNSLAFTTEVRALEQMMDSAGDSGFDRLIESLVQDAGRAAESVASAVRPNIWHVRYLSPPSCSRCAVLAGRVYRYSDGFQRHPNCDCVMIPTTVAAPNLIQDPADLMEKGLITDLSKADAQAVRDGADFGQVVNVRSRKAGLRESGRVLARAGRPTPEGIYRLAGDDRSKAVELLAQHGYIGTKPAVSAPGKPKFVRDAERPDRWTLRDVSVIVGEVHGIPEAEVEQLLTSITTVLERAGDSLPAGVTFVVGGGARGQIVGQVVAGGNTVALNPSLVRGQLAAASRGHAMPVLAETDDLVYTIAHELGHVFDGAHDHTDDLTGDAAKKLYRKHKRNLSRYGQTNRAEGYAEAWAQWLLGGPGSDPVSDAFAEEFGWPRWK